jgi:hypothetical protein
MRKRSFVSIVILWLVSPLLAKAPNPDDFPELFFVRQGAPGTEASIPGQDNRPICYMELESGNMHYSVSRRAPTVFQACHYFIPGQSLHGRRKGGTVELLFHKNGKAETQRWNVTNMYTVQ